MAGDATPRAALAVRRWRTRYLVPEDHPDPQRVRLRLDSVWSAELGSALASQLHRVIDPRDESHVLIRRLSFDLAIDASWDPRGIATRCARLMTASLAHDIAAGDSANVVRFKSRAEYLARFLVDVAQGDALSRWYYAQFAGLGALPASAALRTVLSSDIEAGLDALRALAPRELGQVIATLGERESANVCKRLEREGGAGEMREVFAHLRQNWTTHEISPQIRTQAQVALWLMARASLPLEARVTRAARSLATAIVALQGGHTPQTLSALLTADADVTADTLGVTRDIVETLRDCPAEILRDLVKRATPAIDAVGTVQSFTQHGGGYLLLDDLLAIPLNALLTKWPDVLGVSPWRPMALLILACCCGGSQAQSVVDDPLWRQLFGVPPELTSGDVARWLSERGRAPQRQFRGMLGRLRRDVHSRGSTDVARDAKLFADDMACLAPPVGMCPAPWRRLIVAAAQHVLRRFVHRIPGHADSHARYAQLNFLSAVASVEMEATRIVVTLSRPPLSLMLNLAGLNRGTRSWPALDARPFVLFTEG